jgi:hypothetical protein
MGIDRTYRCVSYLLALVVLLSPAPLAAQAAGKINQPPTVSSNLAAAMAQYRRALEEYTKAQQSYTAATHTYWNSIAEKRRLRNAKRAGNEPLAIADYVLDQPPVYTGPPRPRDPSKPSEQLPPAPEVHVPVVADFLAAAQQEFKFSPRLPHTENEFKRAYVKTALAAGLTKEQIVRIYGFEATGNGNYDIEAGLEFNKRARAITTALGYNQLLATNTVEIMAETGDQFIKDLTAAAARLPGDEKRALESKIAIVHKMIEFSRSVPDDWNQHEALAGTQKGLGIHAMNLDLDVGPLLQTQKLLDSVVFARKKGYGETLSAAELEMMNLTGDGNGFDMVTMPMEWRDKVPTANFFQRSGYLHNPVAQRNNVVAKLIAATDAQMDNEVKKPGAKELAKELAAASR